MTSIDNLASPDSEALPAVLAGLNAAPQKGDFRAQQQAAVLAFARRVNAQPPLCVLMHDATALAADVLQTDLGCVAEVIAGDALMLKFVGGNAEALPPDDSYKTSLQPAESMAGYALSAGGPVVATDLAGEQRFQDRLLRKLGMASALTVPLYVNGNPFGALGVYARLEQKFAADDAQFLETIAQLLNCFIARIKAEEQMFAQRAMGSAVLETVDSPVLTLDAQGNLLEMNPACQRVTGFSTEELREKPFWAKLVPPVEMESLRSAFQRLQPDDAPRRLEASLLTKDGNRRGVSWTLKIVQAGQARLIVLCGTLRAEQAEHEVETPWVEQALEEAAKTMREAGSVQEADAGQREVPAPMGEPNEPDTSPAQSNSQPRAGQGVDEKLDRGLRSSPRQAFHYRQMIAPMLDDHIPPMGKFFPVECRDISAGGLAFLVERPPDFDTLVVALGRLAAENLLMAEVVRVMPVKEDGKKGYLVGCRFIGRVPR